MSQYQVLDSDTAPKKQTDQNESSNKISSQNTIIFTANGIKIESNLNPNALEFYPSYLKNKINCSLRDNVNEKELCSTNNDKIISLKTAAKIPRTQEKKCSVLKIIQEMKDIKEMRENERIQFPKGIIKMAEINDIKDISEKNLPEEDIQENFKKLIENDGVESINCEESIECNEFIKGKELVKCEEVKKFEESKKCKEFIKCDESKICEELDIKYEEFAQDEDQKDYEKLKTISKDFMDHKELYLTTPTVEQTKSNTDYIQKLLETEISETNTNEIVASKLESITKVEEYLEKYKLEYINKSIIEETVVGDHTENQMDQSKREMLEDIAPVTQATFQELKGNSEMLEKTNKVKINKISKIALPQSQKLLRRTPTVTNNKCTGTCKKSLNTTSTLTKEPKEPLGSRKLNPNANVKKEDQFSKMTKYSTNTTTNNTKFKNSLISATNSIKKDFLTKSTTKDSLSLKSSSTDKSSLSTGCITKTSTLKANSSKIVGKSLVKSVDKSSLDVKPKVTLPTKSPRATVSSSLRKTETQKRRNLFPDIDSIKMSEFLFK